MRYDSNIVVESGAPDRCAGLAGNYQAKVLFAQADSESKGETTVLQNRMHPSQKKFFDLLGTHICMPLLYYHYNVGLEPRPNFFRFPILLCHMSFYLHCHYPLRAGGLFHFKKDHAGYSIKAEDYETKPLFVSSKENRLLNEFFLCVLEDLQTSQGLGALKFTSDDPAFVKETVERVYPLTPATPTAPPRPATRAFSRQLVAYIAAFLPTAPLLQVQRQQDFRRPR